MKAFVAGATGLTGREVVAELRRRGVETHAHVRPDSSRLDTWRKHFEDLGAVVDTTAWDAEAMGDRLAALKPDVVFALLGTTRKRAKAGDGDYEAIDWGLSVMLLEAAQASGAPRFVYLGAAGTGPRVKGAYMRVRWRMEERLRASGLPWTSVRPSFIIGDRDRQRPMEHLGAGASDLALGLVGLLGGRKLRAQYRSIAAEQLGYALVRTGLDPAFASRIVEGADLHHRDGV